MHRQATALEGGVNAAVPVGNAVPMGEFGVTIKVPLPAAAVVVTVITPVDAAMAKEVILRVAVGVV